MQRTRRRKEGAREKKGITGWTSKANGGEYLDNNGGMFEARTALPKS